MKKQLRLTETQFRIATKDAKFSKQTLEIAHAVLVEGRSQSEFVKKFQLTKGAVSQAVKRVFSRVDTLPSGFEKVTAVLPEHQAFIVKKWARDAEEIGED